MIPGTAAVARSFPTGGPPARRQPPLCRCERDGAAIGPRFRGLGGQRAGRPAPRAVVRGVRLNVCRVLPAGGSYRVPGASRTARYRASFRGGRRAIRLRYDDPVRGCHSLSTAAGRPNATRAGCSGTDSSATTGDLAPPWPRARGIQGLPREHRTATASSRPDGACSSSPSSSARPCAARCFTITDELATGPADSRPCLRSALPPSTYDQASCA